MTTLAGDLPHYEEATRALFARDRARFDEFTAGWPEDIGHYVRELNAKVDVPWTDLVLQRMLGGVGLHGQSPRRVTGDDLRASRRITASHMAFRPWLASGSRCQ